MLEIITHALARASAGAFGLPAATLCIAREIGVQLALTPAREQRECVSMNQMVALYASYFVFAGNDLAFDGWAFDFTADTQFATGPDFIAGESAKVTIDANQATKVVTINSPAFFAPNCGKRKHSCYR